MKAERKPLVVAGRLMRNCYLSDASDALDIQRDYATEKYYELREETTENGIEHKLVEVDYPITAESVKSYVDSTNYKLDPFGNLAAPRKNLGDVTESQKVMRMDTAEARAMYERLKGVFENAQKQQATPAKEGENA